MGNAANMHQVLCAVELISGVSMAGARRRVEREKGEIERAERGERGGER